MAKQAAIKKRRRDSNASAASASSSSSASPSSDEEEEEVAKTVIVKKEAKANAPVESESDSDSDDDSSDDETENTLFRPAAATAKDDSSDEDDEDEEEESSEDSSSSSEEEEAADKPVAKAVKSKAMVAKKNKKEEEGVHDAHVSKELENEIARKTEATIYIEGIPYKADEGDIVSHFSSCGIVKEVRLPRYQDSGKPRGYGHVVFESDKSIAKALKLDGKYLFGRYLTVKVAERPRTLDVALKEQKTVKKAVKGCRTVFIKHLPYDTEEAVVREALASCGTIASVRLPLWNHTKKLKGFGYVEFSSEDEAVAAVKRSGMKIGDRMVIISLETAASAPKASFRLADGRFWNKGEDAKKALATKLMEKNNKQQAARQQGGNKKQRTK